MRLFSFLAVFFIVLSTFTALADGQVTVQFLKPESARYEKVREHLKQSPYLTIIPLSLDKTFKFPRKLPVIYAEIGRANAFYTPKKHAVVVGYELHETIYKMFRASGLTPEKSLRNTDSALAYILLHEFGHALIGEFELPVTGREEDCADEFATVWGAKVFKKKGTRMALASAHFFLLASKNSRELKDLHFWDEHSLEKQRYYHILSDLNAAMDEELPGIDEIVPRARLDLAKSRFPRKNLSWMRLLSQHFHKDFDLPMLFPVRPTEGHLRTEFGKRPSNAGVLMNIVWDDPNLFSDIVELMDESFYWPRDFTIRFEALPDRATEYNRKKAHIKIDLSFLNELDFALEKRDDKSAQEMVVGVLMFRMMQGISEALIQELELPWTGDQEDVTSEFLTLLMTNKNKGVQGIARGMALFHLRLAKEDKSISDLELWRAGPSDQQRFLDLIGYLYTQNPEDFAVAERLVPAHRRARYKRDLPIKRKRWKTLLEPYFQRDFWR